MANPTPIYVVEYGGQQLPGYVQSDTRPLEMSTQVDTFFGRDGAKIQVLSAKQRQITLEFLIKSSLGTGSSGIQHLEDCMNQYRSALSILSRTYGEQTLRIHDSDRYYLASFDGASMPMEATQSRSFRYTASFISQPWAYSTAPATGSFSGNGTVTLTGLTASRRTYPVFTVPSGVTAFTATDGHGKTLQFLRGVVTGEVTIDCGKLTAVNDSGSNAVISLVSLNFGLYYNPDVSGEMDITVTGYSGSGSVGVSVTPRYEL